MKGETGLKEFSSSRKIIFTKKATQTKTEQTFLPSVKHFLELLTLKI